MGRIPYLGDGPQGVRLVSRIIYDIAGTYAPVVPAGATWCVAKALGAGGARATQVGGNNMAAGGGGAFAKAGFEVNVGDTLSAVVPGPSLTTGTNGSDASFSRAGVQKVLAKGGLAGVDTTGGQGGQSASCVGDVKRSGGNGGTVSNLILATNEGAQGESGPPKATGHALNRPTAGGPASDIGDTDSIGMATPAVGAAFVNTSVRGLGWGGHGELAGAGGAADATGRAGRVAVEFYTGNPNL